MQDIVQLVASSAYCYRCRIYFLSIGKWIKVATIMIAGEEQPFLFPCPPPIAQEKKLVKEHKQWHGRFEGMRSDRIYL